jgi:ABC-type transport system involved in multi-copper enzyme maturation permease subunit
MTTDSVTPYRSRPPVRCDGFTRLLHAEWTKFRTVPGWVLGMAAAVLVTVLVGALGSAGSSVSCAGPGGTGCAGHIPPAGPDGEPVRDSFYLVRQPLAGDGSITVRLTSLTGLYAPDGGPADARDPRAGMQSGVQPWAKAGIIVKDGTGQGSHYAAVMLTGSHGVRMQYDFRHDVAGRSAAVSPTTPRWLRLTRSGAALTGYESADGTHWDRIGTALLAGLPRTVEVGLFAASPEYTVTSRSIKGAGSSGGPTVATGHFDHVRLDGAGSAGTWSGMQVGDASGAQGLGVGYQEADGGFTVTGSGDVAPDVIGQGSGAKTVENALVGAFAGLIVVIVVATLFITAEYRRGLIRTTLAAAPRRGRVLAAKATVIGSVAFVTGLAAAALTVPLVGEMERDKGFYMYPVTTATELRVIVGTAALFAVTAVFTLAIGTLLRRGAAAVTAATVAVVVPYILAVASVLPVAPSQWLERVTPAAGFAIQQSLHRYPQVTAGYTPADGYFPLSPWGGFAVLCGYTVLALGLAAWALGKRDA